MNRHFLRSSLARFAIEEVPRELRNPLPHGVIEFERLDECVHFHVSSETLRRSI